jgi:hypothetical protein
MRRSMSGKGTGKQKAVDAPQIRTPRADIKKQSRNLMDDVSKESETRIEKCIRA